MTRLRLTFLSLLAATAFAPAIHAQREKLPPEDLAFVEKTWPNAKKTNTGIRYVVNQEGAGPVASPGDLVSVIYVGRLLDGTVFDQNNNREQPLKFRVGRDQVIAGWDQILQRMNVGQKVVAIIPPELAYGTRGKPPIIPRDATLVFMVELLEIKRPD